MKIEGLGAETQESLDTLLAEGGGELNGCRLSKREAITGAPYWCFDANGKTWLISVGDGRGADECR